MKNILTILLLCGCLVTHSQEITEAQRTKALAMASQFCELLAQYSSNGDQYVDNDAKIFALCTSQNITAYNDLEGNKEDLLVSYLFTILGKYNNKLEMSFSRPQIEQISGLPMLEVTSLDISGNRSFEVNDFADRYIILGVKQTIASLSKTIDRKIIYSCKEDKIIAFTKDDSPFLTLCKAVEAFSKADYASVFRLVDEVLNHKRFDAFPKEQALLFAMMSAMFSEDLMRLKKYGSRTKDYIAFYNYATGLIYIKQGKTNIALPYLETAVSKGYPFGCGFIACQYLILGTDYRNVQKAKFYFKKGLESNDRYEYGYTACFYAIMGLALPDEMGLTEDQITAYFKEAANNDYPVAYLPLSVLYEQAGKKADAAVWDKKAAKLGSNLGKARFGNFLLSSSDASLRAEGLRYLREAALSDIDSELEDLGKLTGLIPIFPQSLNQVKQLISKY